MSKRHIFDGRPYFQLDRPDRTPLHPLVERAILHTEGMTALHGADWADVMRRPWWQRLGGAIFWRLGWLRRRWRR